MTSKKAASKSSVASDTYKGPITRSCSKGITQEQDQGSNIAKSKKKAHPDVVSVMMVDIMTEAAMAEM
ncbi:uncharacterized protein E5676_scaffold552G00510 [Cucumis melo var. makuwa]|uniref:Ty3-gypsy retrotransposon protein n=1 Tax=Cucumis melo var. makuwa TaxID=1194695 RepID=A0A5D3CVY0_CUCMM|nr:uncharacterized protein E5676_scaffold552G00510 [Cucumis melo var. makuwa]